MIGDFRENFGCIDYEKGTFFVAQNPNPAGRRAYSPQDDFRYRHERAQLGFGLLHVHCTTTIANHDEFLVLAATIEDRRSSFLGIMNNLNVFASRGNG